MRSMPASRAHATARATFSGSWVRPSSASTWARIDCTPSDTRFTPAADVRRELGRVDRVGVALDRHLRAGRHVDGVEDAREQMRVDERRRAASEEHAGCGRERRGARCRARTRRRRRRSGAHDRSTWRSRSSRSAPRRTARARTRRTVPSSHHPRALHYVALVAPTVSLIGVPGIPMVQPGDDLPALLVAALRESDITPVAGDALVVTSKIVSKAEGRIVDLRSVVPSARAIELAAATDKEPELVELVLAGVDRRRARGTRRAHRAPPTRLHLRECGDRPVQRRRERAHRAADARRSRRVGRAPSTPRSSTRSACRSPIVLSDTHGRPWRRGNTGVAVGVAGIEPVVDLAGARRPLRPRAQGDGVPIADQLAGAAALVSGETDEGLPWCSSAAWTSHPAPAPPPTSPTPPPPTSSPDPSSIVVLASTSSDYACASDAETRTRWVSRRGGGRRRRLPGAPRRGRSASSASCLPSAARAACACA